MANSKNQINTQINIGTKNAEQSVQSLKREINNFTKEIKTNEQALKLQGDSLGASKSKMDGYAQAVEKQGSLVQGLEQKLGSLDTTTKAGQDAYAKYSKELTDAQSKLQSLTAQADKAKQAYELQSSGISQLTKDIKDNEQATKDNVAILKSQGKEEEALAESQKGLAEKVRLTTELYDKQEARLKELSSATNKDENAINQQRSALAKTATALTNAREEMGKFKDSSQGVETGTGRLSRFAGIAGGLKGKLLPAVAVVGTLTASIGKLAEKAYDSESKISKLQATTTLTYGQSKKAIAEIGQLYAQGYGDSLDELSEAFTLIQQKNPSDSLSDLIEKTKLATTYSKQSGADITEVLNGAGNATKNLGLSYEQYFDLMSTGAKKGLDATGSLSDEMSEYSQVLGQMGFTGSQVFGLLENGIKSGAYNTDKLLDFTKEFGISLNDGRMAQNIASFSQKTQDMFKGYQEGKVTSAQVLQSVTSDLSSMTDKQKEATLASNLWSALGEDNALKVVESMGKTNDSFTQVKGTAKETADQLKTSNPFDLAKRGAEAFTTSLTLNKEQTGQLTKAFKPLGKALGDLFKAIVKELPGIINSLTPFIQLVADNLPLIVGLMTTLGGLWVGGKVMDFAKSIGAVSTKLTDLWSVTKGVSGKIGGALKWTASVATKGAKTAFNGLTSAGKVVGSTVAKSLKWTASVATKGAVLAFNGLLKAGKLAGNGIKLAFNFLKANPFIMIITGIALAVTAFAELYKHNKKFKKFVDDILKNVVNFAKSVGKWFGDLWDGVVKDFNGFAKYISNVIKSYTKLWSSIFRAFGDLFSGNWKDLGKDIKAIWNNLWGYLTSVFGSKVSWVKNGISSFSKSITNGFRNLKNGVLGIWDGLWSSVSSKARGGINTAIDIVNGGIKGIDGVIHAFGGPKQALGLIPHFANGTGGAPKGLAVVNDQAQGNYREAIIDNNGDTHILSGRNRLVNFSGGETVVPADATKAMLPHFANGTSNWLASTFDWAKDKWDGLTAFLAHPIQSITNTFNNAIDKLTSGLPTFGSAIVQSMGSTLTNAIASPITNLLKGVQDKHNEELEQSAPSGSGVQRWRPQVIKALKANGLSTDSSMVNKVLSQIQTESGGNEKAVQGGYTDVNTLSGDLAKGLMQTISATFNAFAFPGHGDIFNGYDNLLASLNYAKNRYGSNLSALGQGHGYANGGLISTHGLYEVAEGNLPEFVIPTDPNKKVRANYLLDQASKRINGQQSQPVQVVSMDDTNALLQALINAQQILINAQQENTQVLSNQLNGKNITGMVKGQTQVNQTAQRLAGLGG